MDKGAPIAEFPSWRSYWNYARSVSRDFRYIRSPEVEAFLETVLATSEPRRIEIPKGRLFWRAQVGHAWRPMNSDSDDEIPSAHPPARMKPLAGRAADGRANPRGIPCLYLATTKEAAMSEVRPWMGSYVSVGQFRIKRALTVIDCARQYGERPFFFDLNDYNREPSPEVRSKAVWAHIDRAFAEPMTRSDDLADYAPTQILAELFKRAGAEGVVYKSNFGEDGFNMALFDPDAADLVNCGLFEVESVQMKFKEADQFYSVSGAE
jgi:hypothetical protein